MPATMPAETVGIDISLDLETLCKIEDMAREKNMSVADAVVFCLAGDTTHKNFSGEGDTTSGR